AGRPDDHDERRTGRDHGSGRPGGPAEKRTAQDHRSGRFGNGHARAAGRPDERWADRLTGIAGRADCAAGAGRRRPAGAGATCPPDPPSPPDPTDGPLIPTDGPPDPTDGPLAPDDRPPNPIEGPPDPIGRPPAHPQPTDDSAWQPAGPSRGRGAAPRRERDRPDLVEPVPSRVDPVDLPAPGRWPSRPEEQRTP